MGKPSVMAMIRLLVIITVTTFALLAAVACSGGSSNSYQPEFKGGAHVTFDKDAIDFGDVPVGETVEAIYQIRNLGDADLVIDNTYTRVVEGCCPSQPELEFTTLAPGKSGRLTLKMVMGPGMGGLHVFEVQVVTNDPVKPEAHVTAKANFIESLD